MNYLYECRSCENIKQDKKGTDDEGYSQSEKCAKNRISHAK